MGADKDGRVGPECGTTARIAVLIPVYNAPEGLTRTLKSIDAQTCGFDIYVVDDGSEPPVSIRQADYRHIIRVIRLSHNCGIEHALNEGLRNITPGGYEFVARQDAGDIDVNGRLEKQQDYLDRHRDVVLVGSWVEFVDRTGAPIFVFQPPTEPKKIRRRLQYGPAFIHPSTMIRISALAAFGGYSDKYPRSEDYELFYRLASRFPCANIGEVLVQKEDCAGSLSNSKRRSSLISAFRVQIKYFDWATPHSYLGLLYTGLRYIIPYPLLIKIKRIMGSIR